MSLTWFPLLTAGLLAVQAGAQARPDLGTDKARQSYAVGVDLARNLQRQGIPFDVDALLRGMRDMLSASKPQLSDAELREALRALQEDIKQTRARPMKMVAEVNRSEGEAFLKQNRAQEGVVTLPRGLQYRVLREGEGPRPGPEDTVACHLRGTLLNGAEFENTHHRGQPATLRLPAVLPGVREALLGMAVGSTWQVVVPWQLAYGEKGQRPDIGPCATLTFEIELLSIQ